jgi:hypothetical protein
MLGSFSQSEACGTAKRLFPYLGEQWGRHELHRPIAERKAERGKSNHVSKVERDLFEIGGAASGRVVAVLAGRLDRNLPLTSDGLNVRVAKKLHRHGDLFRDRRKEIVVRGRLPGRVKGEVNGASEVCEEFKRGLAIRL